MGLRIAWDRWIAKNASGHTQLGDGGRFVIPADGLQIGADVRLYRGAAGELIAVPLAGQQVNLPNEGIQIGSDLDIWRDSSGNMTFVDADVTHGARLRDFIGSRAEFLNVASIPAPWVGLSNTGGTATQVIGPARSHPGVIAINAVAAANSGYRYTMTSASSILISGGEETQLVFRPSRVANLLFKFGFIDLAIMGNPVDGIWFEYNGGLLVGKTATGGVTSTTVSSFGPLVNATWYRVRFRVNDSATLVTFALIDGATQAVLWSDTLAANIPTAAGNETGHAATFFDTVGGANEIMQLDYMDVHFMRSLVR